MFAVGVDGNAHGIKAARRQCGVVLLEVALRAALPFSLFGGTDGFGSTDHCVGLTGADFDKNQCGAVFGDDVDFAVSCVVVVCYDFQPVLLQVEAGEAFAVLSALEVGSQFFEH